MESTETNTPIVEEQKGITDLYDDAMTIPDNTADNNQADIKKEEQKTEDSEPKANKPTATEDFDLSVLDIELERHGEKKALKEFLKDEENRKWLKEEFQKGWDYEARKNEVKTEKEQLKIVLDGKQAELSEREKTHNDILIRNLALELNMPLKTLEDFENDLRFENPEEAFKEYQESFKEKAHGFVKSVEYAKAVNETNMKDFMESNKDTDIKDLLQKAQPYLNASVSMEHIPFPDDTFKILDRAFNFDRHIENARADERKKVIAELQSKQVGTKNQPTQTTATKPTQNYIDPNLPENVRAYEEAFQI